MISRTTRSFRTLLAALPRHVQRQAQEAYRIFRLNPAHPGHRFKKVHPDPPIFSARVGIGHRAVGALNGDRIVWYWIGTHAKYDELLKSL